jgi:hypothetical protein
MIKKKEPRSKVVYTRLTEREYRKVARLGKKYKVSDSSVLQHMVQEFK